MKNKIIICLKNDFSAAKGKFGLIYGGQNQNFNQNISNYDIEYFYRQKYICQTTWFT